MLNTFPAVAATKAVTRCCARLYFRYSILTLDSCNVALTLFTAYLSSFCAVIAMTLADSLDVLLQCLTDWSQRQLLRILTRASEAIDGAILSLSNPEPIAVPSVPTTCPSEAQLSSTDTNVPDEGNGPSRGTGIIARHSIEHFTQRHPSPRLFLLLALANDLQDFLAGLSIRDLRAICQDARIEGYSRHQTKARLVHFLANQLTQ